MAERTKNNQQYYQCLTCRSCVRFLVAVANRDKQRTQKRQCHPISTGQPNLRFPDLGFDCLIIMGVGCWLVGGWLVAVCLSFVVACCRDIQYPPRLQTAETRATHTHTHTRTHTHTTHARCFVCWWILDVTVVGIRNMIFVFTRADSYQFSYRSELNSMFFYISALPFLPSAVM